MTKLDTNYPLDSCRDCLHTNICTLKEELNKFLSKNPYLDVSNGFCENYSEDEVSPSEDWKRYISSLVEEHKLAHNEDNPIDIDMEILSIEEALEEVIADIKDSRNLIPDKVHVSTETLDLFIDYVEVVGIRYVRTSYGDLEILIDESIDTGYFLVTFMEDDDDSEE